QLSRSVRGYRSLRCTLQSFHLCRLLLTDAAQRSSLVRTRRSQVRKVVKRFTSRRRPLLLVAALLALVLSACDWPSFGFNAAHTRFNPETKAPSGLALRWVTPLEGAVESSPTVSKGVVYVGERSFEDEVYALDAATGETVWTFTTDGDVATSPAVAEGIVYF